MIYTGKHYEAGANRRKIRASLDLLQSDEYSYDVETMSYTLTHNMHTIYLRFDQRNQEWYARVNVYGIIRVGTFTHRPHREIYQLMIDWLNTLLDGPKFDEIEFCFDCGFTIGRCACSGSANDWTEGLPRTAVQNG